MNITSLASIESHINQNFLSRNPKSLDVFLLPFQTKIVVDIYNRRIRVFDGDLQKAKFLIEDCENNPFLAKSFGKVVVYARFGNDDEWQDLGFQKEASVQGFFADNSDANVWAYFLKDERGLLQNKKQITQVLKVAKNKKTDLPEKPENFVSKIAKKEDAKEISKFLNEVFSDYPSDLSAETIQNKIVNQKSHFRFIENEEGEVVSVASAEIDHVRKNAEMTDCATNSDYRGQGLMAYNLLKLEHDMVDKFDIQNVYSMARAEEFGINCAFSKLGYDHTGLMKKHCRMPKGWESFHIWCKEIA